jgi:cell division septum initiation protein DivIVA
VTDNRIKGRVKGLFGGPSAESELMDEAPPAYPDADAERQALQVLVLARRTADEHVATAQHEAERIRTEARARATDVVNEAQAISERARREAEKAIGDARGQAQQTTREAQARADAIRRDAEKVLADAQAQASEVIASAQAAAEELDAEARHRYQEVVGSLEAQREAIQEQIDALEDFDRDYRAQLRGFMQSQLEALGPEQPAAPVAVTQRQPARRTPANTGADA